eukprot:m.125091 g.125091  ORF g.125091 m.125091 type:complete len:119 (-) comp13526_c0_seq1:1564-1920(-)
MKLMDAFFERARLKTPRSVVVCFCGWISSQSNEMNHDHDFESESARFEGCKVSSVWYLWTSQETCCGDWACEASDCDGEARCRKDVRTNQGGEGQEEQTVGCGSGCSSRRGCPSSDIG